MAKLIHVNTLEKIGGSSRAVSRLHKGLQSLNFASIILVQAKYSDDPNIIGPKSLIGKASGIAAPLIDKLFLNFYTKRLSLPFHTQWLPTPVYAKNMMLNSDIIHLHWICGGFINIRTLARIRKPIVWTLHDSWPFTGGCHIPFNCKRFEKACGCCPQLGSQTKSDLSRLIWKRKKTAWKDLNLTVVTPSHWIADSARRSSLFSKYSIKIIPNGIDLQVFKPIGKNISRKILGLPQDKKIILFGALRATKDSNKGFEYLYKSLLNDKIIFDRQKTILIIFGSANPSHTLNIRLHTKYLGQIYDDVTLALLYSSADVMIVPSIQESFGQTALEAIACGLPVVAFNTSGLKDIIDHKINGYLATPYESEDLANGIMWILEDEINWKSLSNSARKKAEKNFDIRHIAKKYSDLYHEIAPSIMKSK